MLHVKEKIMKKRTRTIALLLSLIMTAGALASCSDPEPTKKPTVTAGANSEEDKKKPTFAEADYDGATFTILSKQDEDSDFTDHYIDTEDRTGEPINEAVATRNQLVEEKYNVDIVRRKEGVGYAKTAAQAGTVDFEVVYDWGFRLVPSVMDGIFYDLNQLDSDYVHLDQSYWAPSSHDDLTIADKLMVFTCDISMNRIGWASFLAFNKKIMDDFNLEYPYTYVNNNTWTYDKYLELVQQGYRDVNGDTIMDENDVYGSSGVSLTNIVSSSGWKGYKHREDGSYELDFQVEKLQQIYNEYKNKFIGDTFCAVEMNDWLKIVDQTAFTSPFRAARFASFGQNHLMFTSFTMDETQDLAGMDLNSQYGVVPMPKYRASQSEYYHYIDTCAPMFAIMKQANDEMIAIVLEYMNYESQNTLLPAFFEQTIKTKRMSDPEGRDEVMLDIIRDSVHYDFGSLYGQNGILKPDGTAWNPIGTMLGDMMSAGNFSSVYNKYSSAAQKSLDDFYDKILEMDVNK